MARRVELGLQALGALCLRDPPSLGRGRLPMRIGKPGDESQHGDADQERGPPLAQH
jgi:hypothetical protein